LVTGFPDHLKIGRFLALWQEGTVKNAKSPVQKMARSRREDIASALSRLKPSPLH